MAYKKEELIKQSLKAIEKDDNIVFIDEVVSYLPCSERTFYNYKLQELQAIKDALNKNKLRLKAELPRWLVTTSGRPFILISVKSQRSG